MTTAFSSLALPELILGNLPSLGYDAMTPIQAAALPALLRGADVIAQGKTGSGKTAAFGLGILARLRPEACGVQALVLCPTRELAEQTCGELRRLARTMQNVRILSVCGGTNFAEQRRSLARGVDVVVGTPGRLLDHLDRGSIDLEQVAVLVLDEADRMLDMGFAASIAGVAERVSSDRQTLLFSATYPDSVRSLSRRFQHDAEEITVETPEMRRDIDERFFRVDKGGETAAILALLAEHRPESTLVFCNFKADCDRLVEELQRANVSAVALHGDLVQHDRDHVLLLFAGKSCSVLVATDVAARGLDIKELSVVINYELSPDADVHHHRVGRTGRADQKGLAFSLFSPRHEGRLRAIEEREERELRIDQLPPQAPARLDLQAPMVTMILAAGRSNKLRPTDVLGALTGEGGIPGEHVGKINVRHRDTYVAVKRESSRAALSQLAEGRVKGRLIKARLAARTTARPDRPRPRR